MGANAAQGAGFGVERGPRAWRGADFETIKAMRREGLGEDMPNYRALERSAMLFGVPVRAFMATVVLNLAACLAAMFFFGGSGLSLMSACPPIALAMRRACRNDSMALRVRALEAVWLLRRRNAAVFGRSLTLLPMKYGPRGFDDR